MGSAANGVDLKINSAANGKVMVNGVDIMALVVAQAVEIEALKNTPTLCGEVRINSDAELALLAPATRACLAISTLRIAGVSNTSLLVDAFRTLVMVTGYLKIENNPDLLDLGRLFPALTTVGGHVTVKDNDALADISEAFPVLSTVGQYLVIRNDDTLADLGGAFPALATAGTLYIQNNIILTDVSEAFPALTTVDSSLYIQNNDALTDLGGAFPALVTVDGELNIQGNLAARQRALARGYRGSRPPQPRDQSLNSTNKRRHFQYAVRSTQHAVTTVVLRLFLHASPVQGVHGLT